MQPNPLAPPTAAELDCCLARQSSLARLAAAAASRLPLYTLPAAPLGCGAVVGAQRPAAAADDDDDDAPSWPRSSQGIAWVRVRMQEHVRMYWVRRFFCSSTAA